jgi:DNA polymerase III subunit delta'
MYFRDVIGQDMLKRQFIKTVNDGQLPHAQLITGTSGSGSLPLAIAYARYIACTDKGKDDACGHCAACKQFDKLVHPDTHFVFPIFKPNSNKKWVCDDFLPQWRNLMLEEAGYFSYQQWMSSIKADNSQGMIYAEESDEIIRKLNFKAYESTHKVMIIWLPEKMNETCSNKLLKLLEEPPTRTVFLLVTEHSDALLATIRSRTQLIRVKGIDTEDLTKALRSRTSFDEQTVIDASRMAGGSYLKALEYGQTNEEQAWFLQQFIRCMRGVYTIANFTPDKKLEKQRSLKDLKLWAEEMAKIGREKEKHYLSYAQRLVRENFILNLKQEELSYLNKAERAFSERFSPFINHNNIMAFMNELELAERHIEGNVNARLVFFDLVLQSILLFKR